MIPLTNVEKIWNFLIKNYENPFGVAGLMGNLYAESGLNPQNLQNTYEKKLGLSDAEYTKAVDAGTYSNFAKDAAGYGLAQWTYSARKLNLLNYTKSKNVSIGDLDAQLEFLVKEMAGYTAVVKAIKEAKSVKEASDVVLTKYERPADQSDNTKNKRASYGQKYYDQFVKKEENQVADYSKYINSTGTHYISNSGSDERGKYNSGSAGDQTGKEWQLRSWYSRPWTHVFRYEKDPAVGQTLCNLGCAAALNDNIGYDQYQRTTYWTQLQKVGYDPSKITVKCEEDCSAGTAANVKAAGYLLGIKALQNVSANMTSRNTVENLTKAGFTVLTDNKYLKNGDYLLPGDILLYVNHHVAMNVTKGKKAEEITIDTPTAGEIIGIAIAKGTMNIRSSHSKEASSYGTVKPGTKLNVLEVLSNSWYKVQYDKAPQGFAYTSNQNNKYYSYIPNASISNTRKASSTPSSFDKNLSGEYVVTASSLNVRNGAGTSHKSMVAIPKNTKVQCLEGAYTEHKDVKWLYITFVYKGIQWIGFSSSAYLKKV